MSNALWPSAIYVKVIARVATQWSTEAMAAESAARIGSVPRAKELLGGRGARGQGFGRRFQVKTISFDQVKSNAR